MFSIVIDIVAIIVLIVCICVIVSHSGGRKRKGETADVGPSPDVGRKTQEKEIFPYHAKYLLTKNEWSFYKKLRPVAARHGLCILAKVRLADLVDVDDYLTGNGFYKYFNKIMAKHVDFVLCNPENLAVRFILELDDSSHHTSADRAMRDDFVDKVLTKCGYKIYHAYGGTDPDALLERMMKD